MFTEKKGLLKEPVFFALILTITALKIVYNIKSAECCEFYCGSQPVARENPKSAFPSK